MDTGGDVSEGGLTQVACGVDLEDTSEKGETKDDFWLLGVPLGVSRGTPRRGKHWRGDGIEFLLDSEIGAAYLTCKCIRSMDEPV